MSKTNAMQNMKILMDRRRRSEALTKEEFSFLLKYIQTFPTVIDAAIVIGVSRQVLERVKLTGSGSPETITKIRKKISAKQRA